MPNPNPKKDPETGKFVSVDASSETYKALRSAWKESKNPIVEASDVSEYLECTSETARQRLWKLYGERDDVRNLKVGGNAIVWWIDE